MIASAVAGGKDQRAKWDATLHNGTTKGNEDFTHVNVALARLSNKVKVHQAQGNNMQGQDVPAMVD
jgi:hypothetical protein